MLPYIHFSYLQLGPVKVYTWGFFVALGFLAALIWLAKKYPQEKEIFIDLCLYCLLGAMFGARIFFLLFYSEEDLALKDFFKIWEGGMSSVGGMFGGALAIYLYARYEEINFYDIAQKIAFVLPLGLAIGRVGCFLLNDHPGIKTWAHPFSIAYPDGSRFDLGLAEMIFAALIFIYFLILQFKSYPLPQQNTSPTRRFIEKIWYGGGQKKQLFLENFLIIYGAGRFLFDFLRVGEPKTIGLLPSQYATLIMLAAGIYLLVKKIKRGKSNN